MTAPIIVFGANGGIGEALARRLARAGAPLFLTGRSVEKVGPLADELNARYGVCDVLDEAAVSGIVQEAGREEGRDGGGIAGLAYCVGSIDIKPLRATNEEDFIQAYRLCLARSTPSGRLIPIRRNSDAKTKGLDRP